MMILPPTRATGSPANENRRLKVVTPSVDECADDSVLLFREAR